MLKKVSNRTRSILVGIFILVAYGVLMSSVTQTGAIVMIADIISGLAVIGIAMLMFPLFKDVNKYLSVSYLVLKYVEGLVMITGGVFFVISALQSYRSVIYDNIHIYAFIISALFFYILLYKQKLVPRFICIWGIAGICALALSTILKLSGIQIPIIDYFLVLIITNEIFLAIWLFVKGFKVKE